MTHSDIYTKFMIEYDKANVTSSYPSLTQYEAAVILDKAYLAIIAQKLTGNNTRGMAFEGDTKAIEDMRPLITTKQVVTISKDTFVNNCLQCTLPDDLLYYITGLVTLDRNSKDRHQHKSLITLISHISAERMKQTSSNIPWVKNPVGYLEDNMLYILYDAMYNIVSTNNTDVILTYIKKPNKFSGNVVPRPGDTFNISDVTQFECSETMANEIVNMAVVIATEVVESPRLNTILQTKQLES